MARVELRRDDYEDGVLPPVCILSGAPAEVLVEHRSHRGGGPATLLLLLLGPIGIVIMLIVDRLIQVEAHGLVPLSRAAIAERAARRRQANAVASSGAVGVVAGVIILLTVGPELRLVGVAAGLGGGLIAVLAWCWPAWTGVKGRPDRTGRSVTLEGVAVEFARAYRAQDQQRAEARRAAELGSRDAVPRRSGVEPRGLRRVREMGANRSA